VGVGALKSKILGALMPSTKRSVRNYWVKE